MWVKQKAGELNVPITFEEGMRIREGKEISG